MAICAVLALHVAIGALVLTRPASPPATEKPPPTVLLDIEPPPPPPPPPSDPGRAREEEGAAGKKAEPTPVVAPKPVIPVPAKAPVVAAPVPGTGASPNAGASTAGSGTGAGGSGDGRGGGGAGGGGGFEGYSPARLIENVRRSDYRALTAGRLSSGAAMVSLRVDAAGRATNCRVVRSSGDATVDAGLCPLLTSRLRFRPATDNLGRPIPYSLEYVATWRL